MNASARTANPLPATGPQDHPLLEITAPLPGWLSSASQAVRDSYADLLAVYHRSATRLETHLNETLPSFEDFTRTYLVERIEADLGLHVDPDLLVLNVPKSVSRDYDIDPQFGSVKSYSAPWLASTEREALSLCQLAWLNFAADDEQMAQRLEFAISDLSDKQRVDAGLTAAYLHELIPQLDVAQGYKALLEEVFGVPEQAAAPDSPPQPPQVSAPQGHAELLLAPYESKALLEAFSACNRRQVSEAGLRLFEMAAQARSRADSDAAQLEMHWLNFKPGTAADGASDRHTLSGVCAIRDRVTDRTLIYLPDAPDDVTLIEGATPALAKSRLIQQFIRHPSLIDYVAERTLDTANEARHVSYINQALARHFDGFLSLAPALDLQMAQQQLRTRVWSLHRMVQGRARSGGDLARERYGARNDSYLMYFRALLGLLPGIGTLIALEHGWKEGHEAEKAFKEGRLDDGLLAVGGTVLSVVDVALSIVPGAALVSVLGRLGRRSAGLRAATSSVRPHVLKPFEGYEAQTSLVGATAQSGRDAGTLLKDGQLWIEHQRRAYAVYRRSGEQTLRLKKTALHGYEPPVRLENGGWIYHTDVGLKGGVRSTIAETLIVRKRADPAFTNRHARELLDQFEFPADRQRRMELDIATHYEKHRRFPEWAEDYRRPENVPHTSSQPGTSGTKRKEAPAADSQAKRSAAAETAPLPYTSSSPDAWKSWLRPFTEGIGVEQISVQPPIFRTAIDPGTSFIHMNGSRYDILPSGGAQHPSIVFLKNPMPLEDTFSGFNQTLRNNRHGQPVMASFAQGQWTVNGPLFSQPLHRSVGGARPGMTPLTNLILAEKIFEGGDYGHTGLTATRLINLRGTLNAWKSGQLSPLANLNDPILMLEGSHMTGIGTLRPRLGLSYGPSLQTFNSLDFTLDDVVLQPLFATAIAHANIGAVGQKSLQELMSAVLTRAGYTVIPTEEATFQIRSMMLFRRPGQEQLYVIKTRVFARWAPSFRLVSTDSAIPMSNRWFTEWLSAVPEERALSALVEAREQGNLIKLVGGIRASTPTDTVPKVLIQRVADDF